MMKDIVFHDKIYHTKKRQFLMQMILILLVLVSFTACNGTGQKHSNHTVSMTLEDTAVNDMLFSDTCITTDTVTQSEEIDAQTKAFYTSVLTEKTLPETVKVIYRIRDLWSIDRWELLVCEAQDEPNGIAFYLIASLENTDVYGYRKLDIEIPNDIYQYIQLTPLQASSGNGIIGVVLGFVNENKIQYRIFSTWAPDYPDKEITYTLVEEENGPSISARTVIEELQHTGVPVCFVECK